MAKAGAQPLNEHDLAFNILQSTVHLLGNAVGQHIEIVLHDLRRPEHSIVAIVNGHITGRIVGESVLGGPQKDLGFRVVAEALSKPSASETAPLIIENYLTLAPGGRQLRSSTAVYRDSYGQPFASLCINSDLSNIAAAHACLGSLLGLSAASEQNREHPKGMDQLMAEIIQAACPSGALRMKKAQKIEAVREMEDRGLFIVKGGVEKAADALGVTRYTIYNYLEQIRAAHSDGK
ncbi:MULTISPECIES: transcriptional regulator [unclassified Pseudomonas]|uniref:helix-turn-helix transcriptional regulator n=1 Tax=unclassified Pseudomonas TaxID=196821 RepID=UPI00257A52C9|nr:MULTISPECIES: PAS domain-containing protein [unclassified Pseudomonas]